ncbi:MAG: DNA polymerase IV [Actinomycetota bacterium]
MDPFLERIAHVDMDAFFVEVERLRRPALRAKAVVVGGAGPRGVVASASYEARRRGVSSGMPIGQARRLCPHAVVVPPDHGEYHRVSERVFEVIEGFTPDLEPVSVDEAFIDITGLRLLHSGPTAIAEGIRAAIRREVGLPASVGLATTKLVAKMASRDAKPDGIRLVPAGTEVDYLHPKEVRALWGVGEATYARLEELGVRTVGDLAAFPRETLVRRLGEALGGHLWDLAAGRDDRQVVPPSGARSISVEETYDADIIDSDLLRRELLAHADRLASRLRSAGFVAATVQLKVRFDDFTTVTRSHTFDQPVSTGLDLYRAALTLLGRTAASRRPVRLLGIGTDGLVPAGDPRQLGLTARSWDDLEEVVEEVRGRFGRDAVARARLVDPVPDLPGDE